VVPTLTSKGHSKLQKWRTHALIIIGNPLIAKHRKRVMPHLPGDAVEHAADPSDARVVKLAERLSYGLTGSILNLKTLVACPENGAFYTLQQMEHLDISAFSRQTALHKVWYTWLKTPQKHSGIQKRR